MASWSVEAANGLPVAVLSWTLAAAWTASSAPTNSRNGIAKGSKAGPHLISGRCVHFTVSRNWTLRPFILPSCGAPHAEPAA